MFPYHSHDYCSLIMSLTQVTISACCLAHKPLRRNSFLKQKRRNWT